MGGRRKHKGESIADVSSFDDVVPDYSTLKIHQWLSDNGCTLTPVPKDDFKWTMQCPWCPSQATIRVRKGGKILYKCGSPECCDKDAENLVTHWPPNIKDHFTKWYPKEPDQVIPQDPNYKSWVKIKALGYSNDGMCWYQCSTTGHVTGLKPSAHRQADFYGITPDNKYWLHRFGDPAEGKVKWDWAARTLIEECHARGPYDPMNTRGTGIYFDRRRLLINASTELKVDGTAEGIFDFDGEYLYESRVSISDEEIASNELMTAVYALIKRFPFVDAGGADVTMGMVICAYLAGILEWRPHAWAIGQKGSGKTELLKMVADLTMPCGGRFHQGATTSPGVVQGLRNSATIVVLDEQGEVHNVQQNERIQSLVQLARNSSARIKATVAKGGAYGKGSEYITSCCFLFGSIFHSIDQPQDKDRFCFIKLAESKESKDGWPKLQADLAEMLTHETANAMFWRAATDARSVLAVVKSFVETLARVPANRRRDCDQWGTVLGAAWWATHPDRMPSESEVLDMYSASRTDDMTEEDAQSSFGEIAIRSLLSLIPPGEHKTIGGEVGTCNIEGWRDARERNYRAQIQSGIEPAEAFLQRYGLRVDPDDRGVSELVVAKKHPKIKEIMTRIGFPNYEAVLMTYPNARKITKQKVFDSVHYSGSIGIPLEGLVSVIKMTSTGIPAHREIRAQDAEQREPWSDRTR